jgi:hypothetical protein
VYPSIGNITDSTYLASVTRIDMEGKNRREMEALLSALTTSV